MIINIVDGYFQDPSYAKYSSLHYLTGSDPPFGCIALVQGSHPAKTLWVLKGVRKKVAGYIAHPLRQGKLVTCAGGEVPVAVGLT